ncbi:ESPR-type extended signal peptide-containing protein [Acinetobacter sp. c1-l78]|uniref:ESPR domain-containing protein n=2 Tax=unclassified Acinetobacter TaxID=196816 RepID=UPI0035BB760B
MNKVYRVIFNRALNVWQCVSELAKSNGKSKSIKALTLAVAMVSSSAAMAVDYTSGTTTITTSPYQVANDTVSGSSTILNVQDYYNTGSQATIKDSASVNATGTAQNDGAITIDSAKLHATEFNTGNKTTGTLTANNAKIDASKYVRFGFEKGSQGSGTLDKTTLNAGEELVVGFKGNGTLNLNNDSLVNSNQLTMAVDTNSHATLNMNNANLIATNAIGIGVAGTAELNFTSTRKTSDPASKAVYVSAKQIIVGMENTSNGKFSMNGYSHLHTNNFIIGDKGAGQVNLNQMSPYAVGLIRLGDMVIGNQNTGIGELNIIGTAIYADTITVGNQGKGKLNLVGDSNDFLAEINVKQIRRDVNAQQSDVYINGGEISLDTDQSNLFENFTANNKIELGEKGITFAVTNLKYLPTTINHVRINPNAVITGNIKSLDFNNVDASHGFGKYGYGTLEMDMKSKQFKGDLLILNGTLKLNGDYVMQGENLVIGLLDWNDDKKVSFNDGYGKLVVTGKTDISNGNLMVYAIAKEINKWHKST